MSAPLGGRVGEVVAEATGSGARVTIFLDRPAAHVSALALDGPKRLVLDLAGHSSEARSIAGEGPVARVRSAQFDAGTARLVLDLAEPVALTSVAAPDDRRLVLTIDRADEARFARLVRDGRATVFGAAPEGLPAAATADDRETGRVLTVGAAPAALRAVSYRPGRPIVVIDPGHGGKDVGAISVHEQRHEKDLTLAVARAIKRELDASGVVTTLLTRSDDRFIPLHERVALARAAHADIFISVHADAAPNPLARGATIYTLSEIASDREAARLAAQENKADIIAGVDLGREANDVSDILIHLSQRNAKNASAEFAATMQREMQTTVKFTTNYHRFAGFRVLKAADMPAVLLETGYLTNAEDARWLHTADAQRTLAKGVRRAVESHFRRRIARAD